MTRAAQQPTGPFMRHPLAPHQLVDRVTRVGDVIVLCHLGVPRLDADAWSLVIDGLVRRPLRLTLDEIKRRRRVDIESVHQCCGSPLEPEMPTRRVCNVVWTGIPLADLIAECEPTSQARFVWSYGADHGVFEGDSCDAFIKDIPLDRMSADVLIAYAMNGEPLRPEHGFPARLVVPGFYGTNSVKWLTRMALADARPSSPFTTRWYNDPIRGADGHLTGATKPVASIAPESVVVSPAPSAALSRGVPVEVWGWAWGDGGVAKVEVSRDRGSGWMPAILEPPAGRSWQRFKVHWRPESQGEHELWARAKSMNGQNQPPSGARNAMHRVPVVVR